MATLDLPERSAGRGTCPFVQGALDTAQIERERGRRAARGAALRRHGHCSAKPQDFVAGPGHVVLPDRRLWGSRAAAANVRCKTDSRLLRSMTSTEVARWQPFTVCRTVGPTVQPQRPASRRTWSRCLRHCHAGHHQEREGHARHHLQHQHRVLAEHCDEQAGRSLALLCNFS